MTDRRRTTIPHRTAARRIHGPAVRALREALGYKHGVFAIDCDISPGYLTNVEKGLKQPSPTVAAAIAANLGVPLAAIQYVVEECAACTAERGSAA